MSSSRKPQKPGKELQLVELLPGEEVIQSLKKTWAIIVSRVICKYLPAFQCFRKLVIHHIPHKYTTEMSKRSKSVSFNNKKLIAEKKMCHLFIHVSL